MSYRPIALIKKNQVYDPKDHPYPMMLYRNPGQTTGGTPVQSEEEHLAVLQQWEDEDKTKGKAEKPAEKLEKPKAKA